MASLRIYRRELTNMTPQLPAFVIRLMRQEIAAKSKRPTKAILEVVHRELELARVRRDDLESFIESGGFHQLTPLDSRIIRNAALRRRDYSGPDYCYTFTTNDLGRAGRDMNSTAMSARIWIDRYYVATGALLAGELAIVVDPR